MATMPQIFLPNLLVLRSNYLHKANATCILALMLLLYLYMIEARIEIFTIPSLLKFTPRGANESCFQWRCLAVVGTHAPAHNGS
jgi:hypothetical protein